MAHYAKHTPVGPAREAKGPHPREIVGIVRLTPLPTDLPPEQEFAITGDELVEISLRKSQ